SCWKSHCSNAQTYSRAQGASSAQSPATSPPAASIRLQPELFSVQLSTAIAASDAVKHTAPGRIHSPPDAVRRPASLCRSPPHPDTAKTTIWFGHMSWHHLDPTSCYPGACNFHFGGLLLRSFQPQFGAHFFYITCKTLPQRFASTRKPRLHRAER